MLHADRSWSEATKGIMRQLHHIVLVTSDHCFISFYLHEKLYAFWYHLRNLENVKNTHEGVLLLVKLQASAFKLTKSNTRSWVFFTFYKLHKWYQIAQNFPEDFIENWTRQIVVVVKFAYVFSFTNYDFFHNS